MFTGIIEEIGTLDGIQKSPNVFSLTFKCKLILDDLKLGDSVAVNGVCLTVSSFGNSRFSADVMPETLSRSNLGALRSGDFVNLERAMPLNGRFGGHIVSGHIDGTGTIVAVKEDINAIWYTINAPEKINSYIVEKGSITIDGISLTVASLSATGFKVSVIPHTQKITTLSKKHIGSTVNLENDIVGKYIEKFVKPAAKTNITKEFLQTYDF